MYTDFGLILSNSSACNSMANCPTALLYMSQRASCYISRSEQTSARSLPEFVLLSDHIKSQIDHQTRCIKSPLTSLHRSRYCSAKGKLLEKSPNELIGQQRRTELTASHGSHRSGTGQTVSPYHESGCVDREQRRRQDNAGPSKPCCSADGNRPVTTYIGVQAVAYPQ